MIGFALASQRATLPTPAWCSTSSMVSALVPPPRVAPTWRRSKSSSDSRQLAGGLEAARHVLAVVGPLSFLNLLQEVRVGRGTLHGRDERRKLERQLWFRARREVFPARTPVRVQGRGFRGRQPADRAE